MRFLFNLTSLASFSLRFHFGFTSTEIRIHFGFNSISMRFKIQKVRLLSVVTATGTPEIINCLPVFILSSLRDHFDFTLMSIRLHFDFTTDLLGIQFDFTSNYNGSPLDLTSISHGEKENALPHKGKGKSRRGKREKGKLPPVIWVRILPGNQTERTHKRNETLSRSEYNMIGLFGATLKATFSIVFQNTTIWRCADMDHGCVVCVIVLAR